MKPSTVLLLLFIVVGSSLIEASPRHKWEHKPHNNVNFNRPPQNKPGSKPPNHPPQHPPSPNGPNYGGCKHIIVGAGIGGLYMAHTLANETKYPITEICVFEKNNRIGGRHFSFRSEDGRMMAELGGAAYELNRLVVEDTIVDAFGLGIRCYNYLSPDCGASDDRTYQWYRGVQGFQDLSYENPDNFPNGLRPYEKWNESYPYENGPWEFNYYQVDVGSDVIEASYSENKTEAWEAMNTILEFMRTEPLPGTNLSFSQVDLRMGNYDPETGEYVRHSAEYWKYLIDNIGWADTEQWTYSSSLYTLNIEGFLYSGDTSPIDTVFVDENGNNIGYQTIDDVLAKNFTDFGGRIFLGHEITGIYENPDGTFKLTGVKTDSDGRRTVPFKLSKLKDVTLNTDALSFEGLSKDSIVFTQSPPEFAVMRNLIRTNGAIKMYAHYNTPWIYQMLNITSGRFNTDEPLRALEWGQTYPDCDPETYRSIGCGVWYPASYTGGMEFASFWDSANTNGTDQPIFLDINDPITSRYLDEIHFELIEGHRQLFYEKGFTDEDINNIPKPDRGLVSIWLDGWTYTRPNNFPPGTINKAFRQPIPNKKICVVNTDYSLIQGWAEGSLVSVLEALRLCHDNLKVSNIPDAFYEYIVDQFY